MPADSKMVESATHNLVGRTIALRDSNVIVLAGYARHGNVDELFHAVAEHTRNGQIPFLCVADFNVTPDVLQNHIGLTALQACIITPENTIRTS